MGNGAACGLPNMLLRVEIRSGSRKPNDLQTRVGIQDILDWLTSVPRCPVPQKHDGNTWQGLQNLLTHSRNGYELAYLAHRRASYAEGVPGHRLKGAKLPTFAGHCVNQPHLIRFDHQQAHAVIERITHRAGRQEERKRRPVRVGGRGRFVGSSVNLPL